MWLASTKLNQPQNCYQLLRPMHYPRNFGFSYIKEGKTKKREKTTQIFFSHFFIVAQVQLSPFSTHHSTDPAIPTSRP